MKYNVGDRVKIKEYLEYNEKYGGVFVTDAMLKHCGEVFEIVKVNNLNNNYMLKDCGHLWFNEDMLEPIKVETETKEKTSLEKALELLNMTEEEMNKEYDRRKYVPLAEEIEEKSRNRCWECNRNDDSCDVCEILFTIKYLKEKGLLKDEF